MIHQPMCVFIRPNTFLLYIPLFALTDGQTDRQTDRESNTLALHGLEELFSSCAVVSVFGSGGKQVLVLHTTYILRVSYHTVVVLCQFFWFWREIVFCVFLYNPTLFYSASLIYFFQAATAFDIFGIDNAEELLTCGFQYPSLPISILHFVARIFGHK